MKRFFNADLAAAFFVAVLFGYNTWLGSYITLSLSHPVSFVLATLACLLSVAGTLAHLRKLDKMFISELLCLHK